PPRAGVAPRRYRLLRGFPARAVEGALAWQLREREDLVRLPADLGDRRPDGVRDREVIRLDEPRRALDLAVEQDAAASHYDDRERVGARLGAVHELRDAILDLSHAALDEPAVEGADE